jgi:exonuclease VII small subunit
MKRFLALWRRIPKLQVRIVGPVKMADPMAVRALESFQSATASLETAVSSLHRAQALIEKLNDDLGRARAELRAHDAASMEPEEQVAALYRMQLEKGSHESM